MVAIKMGERVATARSDILLPNKEGTAPPEAKTAIRRYPKMKWR